MDIELRNLPEEETGARAPTSNTGRVDRNDTPHVADLDEAVARARELGLVAASAHKR